MNRNQDNSGDHKLIRCPDCRYSWQGLPSKGRCPECGFDYNGDVHTWTPTQHLMLGFSIPCFLICIAILKSIWSGSPQWKNTAELVVGLLLALFAGAVGIVCIVYRFQKRYIVCDDDGVRMRKGWSTHSVKWEDVAGIKKRWSGDWICLRGKRRPMRLLLANRDARYREFMDQLEDRYKAFQAAKDFHGGGSGNDT